ncbi:protein kinase, ATP binding site-containing protein, partial [Tanacetum coccineum]
MTHIKDFDHLKIQLEAIKSATSNFAAENVFGNGGFGKVYKGEIVHFQGKSPVAFKRLDRSFGQGNPEFWKEIMMLSLYRHENIVSLLGFCDESNEKILVYEYMSKRSLDLYLTNDNLTWIQRLEICIGAARGLAYLHSSFGTHTRVLHRDIKSANILLDEHWNAKISDFGLSKFGPADQQFTFLFSNAVGTVGYCDPLYVETGFLTKESDVYSFGVVLFEVLCGRLCIGNESDKGRPLTGLAREFYELNRMSELVFCNIKDEVHLKSLQAYSTLAYQCVKKNREERPLMTEVVRILESALEYQVNGESLKLSDVVEVHKLKEESSSIFNIKYFEDTILAGKWDETERYLNQFTNLEDNRYSMKIYFIIRKQKYLEALDRQVLCNIYMNDRANAVEILVKELKIFSKFNAEVIKEAMLDRKFLITGFFINAMADLLSTNIVIFSSSECVSLLSSFFNHNACVAAAVAAMNSDSQDDNATLAIIHETTAPYTLQQNGVAERKNRALKETVNSMLSYSGLSEGFWGEAIAVVRLPDPKHKTLGEKGIDCIFVRYAEHSKAYRFYVIEPNDFVSINSIIESRDVIFDENRFSSILRPKDIIPNVQESQMDDHNDDVPSEIPAPRKGKRVRKAKSYGSDFQLYLVKGSRYQVGSQYSYCFSIEEDPRTYNEAMQSR